VIEDGRGRDVGRRQAELTTRNVDKAVERLEDGQLLAVEVYDRRDFDATDLFLELHRYEISAAGSSVGWYGPGNSLSFGLNMKRTGLEVDGAAVVRFMQASFELIDGIYGYGEYGVPFGKASSGDAHFVSEDLLSYQWHEVREEFRSRKVDMRYRFLDVHWENYLTDDHLTHVGDTEQLREAFGVVKSLEKGKWYLRVTRGVPTGEYDEAHVQRLVKARGVLEPVLV
jgi:hypothetical protein